MSFIKAFLASCRGPYSFIELRRQAGWRVVLHLFLTVLVSCIFIGIGRYCALKYFWSRPEQRFVEIFGSGVTVSKAGMLPEKEPGTSRRMDLPYNGLLIYVSPNGAEKSYPDEALKDRNFILLWTPGYAALALRDLQKNNWSFAAFDAADQDGVPQIVQASSATGKAGLSVDELRKEILKVAARPLPENFRKTEFKNNGFLPSSALFKMMRGTMAAINSAAYFRLAVFMIFFGVCAYMAVFWIAERFPGSDRRISTVEMVKIVCYTACPVIVVVNVFPMLQLPFESWYEKIFLVAWVIYINIVKRWLEKHYDLLENQEVK